MIPAKPFFLCHEKIGAKRGSNFQERLCLLDSLGYLFCVALAFGETLINA